jgi:diacylglycerol kinase family enzyme
LDILSSNTWQLTYHSIKAVQFPLTIPYSHPGKTQRMKNRKKSSSLNLPDGRGNSPNIDHNNKERALDFKFQRGISTTMESPSTHYDKIPTKLIFNPNAGATGESPVQLMDVINELQDWRFVPETYLVESDCNLAPVVEDALGRDIRMFVVCGGDGTVESLAEPLVNKDVVLGIIPTGTRNNVALSLGIPKDIKKAVSLLRTGQQIKIDIGFASCDGRSRIFLETCSVGLLSALYPATEEIRHGNLNGIGGFLATLITSPLAKIRLIMDSQPEISAQGHVSFVSNLPYVGPNFQITSEGSFCDGLLDVLVFTDESKLDLLANIFQMAGGDHEDPGIRRYQARRVEIRTEPKLPIMTDGFPLGEGLVSIHVQQCALAVMAGKAPVHSEAALAKMV